jgi:cytochrome P450
MKFAKLPLSRDSVFRPSAPLPRPTAAGPFSLVRALWTNPIEAWTREHFERFIVVHRLPFGEVVVASHPAAVRRVLADNAANYRKDRFQKRMLAVLSNGLLTAQEPQWRLQRRAMAPVFTVRMVVIAPYVLHRHCMWWNAPDVFDPARFLPRAHGGIDRYVYLPFGAGPRGSSARSSRSRRRRWRWPPSPAALISTWRRTTRSGRCTGSRYARGAGCPWCCAGACRSLAALPRSAAMEHRALADH